MDEKLLARQASAGDKEAFAALYMRYRDDLYRYAYFRLGNEEDARDAVANAVAYAWEHLKELKNDACFDAWLLKITYSEAVSVRRRSRRYESIEELADTFSYETDDSDLHFFDILCRAGLDGKTHRIFILRFLYGYTLPEIAEMTRENLNTVKAKYYRALRKMADMKGLL